MRTRTPNLTDRVLDVAAQLFGTLRFHEVRMEDISEKAGVGKGTLYRYFSDKEELFLAMLSRASRQFMARIHDALATLDDPRDCLQAIVEMVIAYFDEHPHLFDLLQRAEVLRGSDFPWQDARGELLRLVTDLLTEGTTRGDFTVRDPELAMLMLLGGLRGVIRFGKRPRPVNLSGKIVDTLLNGHAESAHA